MKKQLIIGVALFVAIAMSSNAQEVSSETKNTLHEKHGATLNLGAGIGYYGYVGNSLPVGILNFEIDVVRNFTLAPFVGAYAYQRNYYWKDSHNPNDDYRYYRYSVMVVPVGVKGTYYFDELFHTNSHWDFYAAASVGFNYTHVVWESGYYGDTHVYKTATPLYLGAHVGMEYHFNKALGLFGDLSTGVSTVGLAVHF